MRNLLPIILIWIISSNVLASRVPEHFKSPLEHLSKLRTSKQSQKNIVNDVVEADTEDVPEISIAGLGTVTGKVLLSSLKKREYTAFFSIPYAKPPINKRRFKYAKEWSGPWTESGHYDGTQQRARCAQASLLFSDIISGSEDCLHLSIYRPRDTPIDKLLPVMVFVHGGAYTAGDATMYLPTKLMDRDVVVVVVQYRLSTLGFIYSGTDNAPGNMGLMDQVMSLRWVQDYIVHFGGDKETVTVFGQSAGGASASLMTVTPLSNATHNTAERGQLFHRAIPMSGSALEYWTIDNSPQESILTHALAYDPPCYKDGFSNDQIIDCMRERSLEEIVLAGHAVYVNDRHEGRLGFLGMCPVVQDSEDLTVEIVMPKNPTEIVEDGLFLRVPVMQGSVRDEGSLVSGLAYESFLLYNTLQNDTLFLKNELIPTLMKSFGIEDTTGSVSNAMRLAFFKGVTMGDFDDMAPGMVDMTGMLFLKAGAWTMAHKSLKAVPDHKIYFYSFEFESDDNLFEWIFSSDPDIPIDGGIGHADDLLYLFALPSHQDAREKRMAERLSTLWSNFAIYGEPTPDIAEPMDGVEKWKPFNMEDEWFMLIQDELAMHKDYTTRWYYHAVADEESREKESKELERLRRELSSRESELEDTNASVESYQVATGVLGGLLACVISIALIYVVLYHNKSINSIA